MILICSKLINLITLSLALSAIVQEYSTDLQQTLFCMELLIPSAGQVASQLTSQPSCPAGDTTAQEWSLVYPYILESVSLPTSAKARPGLQNL